MVATLYFIKKHLILHIIYIKTAVRLQQHTVRNNIGDRVMVFTDDFLS